jgi:signal transduction histidine kinase
MMIILDNALKYSRGDIKISAQEKDDKVEIQFEDQGPGIPSDELSHIFERFYRPEENRTIPGFGLGLPIAKSLVEGMGGHISIQSQVGIGINITILFKTF